MRRPWPTGGLSGQKKERKKERKQERRKERKKEYLLNTQPQKKLFLFTKQTKETKT